MQGGQFLKGVLHERRRVSTLGWLLPPYSRLQGCKVSTLCHVAQTHVPARGGAGVSFREAVHCICKSCEKRDRVPTKKLSWVLRGKKAADTRKASFDINKAAFKAKLQGVTVQHDLLYLGPLRQELHVKDFRRRSSRKGVRGRGSEAEHMIFRGPVEDSVVRPHRVGEGSHYIVDTLEGGKLRVLRPPWRLPVPGGCRAARNFLGHLRGAQRRGGTRRGGRDSVWLHCRRRGGGSSP